MRKIIVQDEILESSDLSINYVLWLSVPAGKEVIYANLDAVSVVKDVTQGELDALKAGQVIEKKRKINLPKESTITSIKSALEEIYNSDQSLINSRNTYKYYGSFWDGTTWTLGGIA